MLTRRKFCFAILIILYAGVAGAGVFASNAMYQTPPVLYVGDKGNLVYPLDVFTPLPDGELAFPDGLPRADDIIIHKIELDRRNRRVIIEFQAFRTGAIQLPPIPFGSTELKGLQVNIASILDSDKGAMTLSPSAGTLAAPGTFWMIAAFSTLITLVLAAVVLLCAKGGVIFTGARNILRTRVLLFWINSRLRRLEKRLKRGRVSEKDALALLSNEIRAFLSLFWRQPCYAFCAEEFLYIAAFHAENDIPAALYAFFKKCDETRFSSAGVSQEAAAALCAEAKSLCKEILSTQSVPAAAV
ncbi:MAG: hypothetical protein LBJ35_00715 [Spirochaetaceae bacterium]|jgi:hypothetical protein|nr:hypothetical protein [Spirochaetaceae bacterium]